ncbi:MAG TPA: hypothetical protein VKS60_18630 [Stellaceae bacterium]|nr:hypothetical protein [Stellaceae bacterium]
MKLYICAAVAASMLAVGQAGAGTVTNGTWAPTSCGEQPKPPPIDLSSADAFNKSLNANDTWETAWNKYYDCAQKEVAADNKATADAYKSMQDTRKAAVDKNEADVKTGMDKYAGKKK